MKSGICNCLALFAGPDPSPDHSADVVGWALFVLDWFARYEIAPDRLIVDDTLIQSAVDSAAVYNKLLEIRRSKVTNLELYCTVAGSEELFFDWDAFAALSKGSYLLLCLDRKLRPFASEQWIEVVRNTMRYFPCCYGIGYERDFELGPAFYGLGVVAGLGFSPEEMKLSDSIGKWGHARRGKHGFPYGYFRDLYPLNLVSEAHLLVKLRGRTLREWLCSCGEYGTLQTVNNDLWAWSLSEDQLARARGLFEGTNYLMCAMR